MSNGKATPYDKVQAASDFRAVRGILLRSDYTEHRQRPLAYWALPTDRRLPLAFLSRTLEELLNTSFDDLAATPGIGNKKLRSLLVLFQRAIKTNAEDLPDTIAMFPDKPGNNGNPLITTNSSHCFDPESISEMLWKQWQSAVIEHKLENETFGRMAASLKNVTKVIWNSRLGEYSQLSLSELQNKKTHGAKRVQAILEVFHTIHEMTAQIKTQQHLIVRILPRIIHQVETWIAHTMQKYGVPSQQEIDDFFILPLFKQIRVDTSEQIVQLAEYRLGLDKPLTSVRQVAREMNLTRARVYQLLNEINDIMTIRWPNGRFQVYELCDKFNREWDTTPYQVDLSQFHAAVELFYPSHRRGASGVIEPTDSLSHSNDPFHKKTGAA